MKFIYALRSATKEERAAMLRADFKKDHQPQTHAALPSAHNWGWSVQAYPDYDADLDAILRQSVMAIFREQIPGAAHAREAFVVQTQVDMDLGRRCGFSLWSPRRLAAYGLLATWLDIDISPPAEP
jgi:hypothetical protein